MTVLDAGSGPATMPATMPARPDLPAASAGLRLLRGLRADGSAMTLAEHWAAWESGDRKGALAKIPDSLVDDLVINGTPDECRTHIQRYVSNGVTTPALLIMGFGGIDVRQAARDLAPR